MSDQSKKPEESGAETAGRVRAWEESRQESDIEQDEVLRRPAVSRAETYGYAEEKNGDPVKSMESSAGKSPAPDTEELTGDKEKRIFYAALFLSGKPVETGILKKMFDPVNLENRLLNYAEEFNSIGLGIKIRAVSGGYQIVTEPDVSAFLEKYYGEKTESLSRASLETAAIIAYRQPVTKAEVEEMRGVNSSGTMRYLLDKNLIKVTGRKQVPGKPLLYGTTKYFLEYFGLNDLSELPTFREWRELRQN